MTGGIHVKRFVIGNWKCYKTLADARAWFDKFAEIYQPIPDVSVILAPSYVCLDGISDYIRKFNLENVSLAAQDISPFPKGAYTGAVAADMIKGMVDYVIVGHSDRRRYFHETPQDIINKVSEAVDAGLGPIVCVDRPSAMLQLSLLKDIDAEKMIIAYGPVDALNFRIPQSPENVEKAAREIAQIHPHQPIVYGGSVDPENARNYSHLSTIAGLFIGAASLDAESFTTICNAMKGVEPVS
jgi:triosephosphate isomerase (TIM)